MSNKHYELSSFGGKVEGSMRVHFTDNDLQHAQQALRQGAAVAFGTDTVWGIGVDPFQEEALVRLYRRKGRPEEKGLQVLCASVEQAQKLIDPGFLGSTWQRLIGLWPGALTVVAPAGADCPRWLMREGKVGVRIPAASDATHLLEQVGLLAASSLNRSGEPPITSYQAALDSGLADFVLPGPPTSGEASTVYDASTRTVLRQGALSARQLQELLCST